MLVSGIFLYSSTSSNTGVPNETLCSSPLSEIFPSTAFTAFSAVDTYRASRGISRSLRDLRIPYANPAVAEASRQEVVSSRMVCHKPVSRSCSATRASIWALSAETRDRRMPSVGGSCSSSMKSGMETVIQQLPRPYRARPK